MRRHRFEEAEATVETAEVVEFEEEEELMITAMTSASVAGSAAAAAAAVAAAIIIKGEFLKVLANIVDLEHLLRDV